MIFCFSIKKISLLLSFIQNIYKNRKIKYLVKYLVFIKYLDILLPRFNQQIFGTFLKNPRLI